ncbi:MAG: LytR/AlgR family response regulator transcription factor [Crocinitomicaceae bacterium]
MKKIKTIIIDDERLAREELKHLLSNHDDIEVIGTAQNGLEGIKICQETSPDLIFLDISMPGMDGFEMLQKMEHIPNVIFVTAFDEFASKAFDVKALDYILKPIDPIRLEEAIQKIKSKDDFESQVNLKTDSGNRILTINDHIFIKDGEKTFFIPLSKVRYFESEGNYVKVFFENKRPLILRSLNQLEEQLDPDFFFRANRKFIINIQFISKIDNWFNGGLLIELFENEKIEISRRQATKFKDYFSI